MATFNRSVTDQIEYDDPATREIKQTIQAVRSNLDAPQFDDPATREIKQTIQAVRSNLDVPQFDDTAESPSPPDKSTDEAVASATPSTIITFNVETSDDPAMSDEGIVTADFQKVVPDTASVSDIADKWKDAWFDFAEQIALSDVGYRELTKNADVQDTARADDQNWVKLAVLSIDSVAITESNDPVFVFNTEIAETVDIGETYRAFQDFANLIYEPFHIQDKTEPLYRWPEKIAVVIVTTRIPTVTVKASGGA